MMVLIRNIIYYTLRMEDIRAVWQNTAYGRQGTFTCQMDPDEVMRRVPGILVYLRFQESQEERLKKF